MNNRYSLVMLIFSFTAVMAGCANQAKPMEGDKTVIEIPFLPKKEQRGFVLSYDQGDGCGRYEKVQMRPGEDNKIVDIPAERIIYLGFYHEAEVRSCFSSTYFEAKKNHLYRVEVAGRCAFKVYEFSEDNTKEAVRLKKAYTATPALESRVCKEENSL